MTLLEMITSLRAKVGSPAVADVSNDALRAVINTAYRDIGSKYAFNEVRCIKSFNTVAGDARYDLPTDLAALFRVWNDTEKKKLQKRGVRFLATTRKNQPNGKPLYYVRAKNWIQVDPTPDAVYNLWIYYLTTISDMVADGDRPVLPVPWHYGIILRARHIYYDDRGDVGKAIYCKNEWRDWVADKPSEIDLEKDDLEDSGVVVSSLGGEHHTTYSVRSDYEHYPTAFDHED